MTTHIRFPSISIFLMLTICIMIHNSEAAEFFISLNGNDSWSGTLAEPNRSGTDGPFATIEKTRDAVRSLKKDVSMPAESITVYIRGGIYENPQNTPSCGRG